WYDRYHCYQDANRDPAGIDRLKGRLYRVRYQETPRVAKLDLATETDDQLIARLGTHNDFLQSTAQRVLTERLWGGNQEQVAGLSKKLYELVTMTDKATPLAQQRRALFLLCSQDQIDPKWHWALLQHADPIVRAWAVRATTSLKKLDETIQANAGDLARDPSRDVQLQVAIAARKLEPANPGRILLNVLAHCGDDKLIPQIVWQNLHPSLETGAAAFVDHIAERSPQEKINIGLILPRAAERLLAQKTHDTAAVVNLLDLLLSGKVADEKTAQLCLATVAARVQSGEVSGANLEALKRGLRPVLKLILADGRQKMHLDAALLATSWRDQFAMASVRHVFADWAQPEPRRIQALEALVAANDSQLIMQAADVLGTKLGKLSAQNLGPDKNPRIAEQKAGSIAFRGQILAALGRFDDPDVAEATLKVYPDLDPELQPRVVELLTQRADWSKSLLAAIAKKTVPASAVNVNQVRKLLTSKDPELKKQVIANWGTIRDERNPQREQVIAGMRRLLRKSEGNPHEGQKIFAKVCGQCHKIYGEGAEVGPDITLNGRSSFEQLLSNVFDPSLVIGASYQARTIVTTEGRVLTGLVAEDNDQRVILKVQGGKLETIPRGQIEESKISALSMMPEDLEKQLNPQEIADLFAFITLDKPPTDASAKQLPGTRAIEPRATTDPAQFAEVVNEVAPGFTLTEVGEGGVAILAEHLGRAGVLRTHPISRDKACILTRTVTLPADKKSRLLVEVSHDVRGDWRLLVVGNNERLVDEMISKDSTTAGWVSYNVDLSKFAGKEVKLQLFNQANDWAWEFGYWGRVDLVSE
ncbi:MAG: rane-bound dehydrogenase domain protein, partial [Planctomycetaceae bacterium]|nr:rane-bound dehydrogenase domain protein [Planctomycetaceae bacterium]